MKAKGLRHLKRIANAPPDKIKRTKDRQLNRGSDGKRGPGKRASVNKTDLEERRLLAFEMRLGGASYPKIAKELGISTVTAYKDVMKVLALSKAETEKKAGQVRKMEVERLDRLLESVWSLATKGVPYTNANGDPVLDEEGNEVKIIDKRAIDRVLKIMERRSKLLGVDMPVKIAAGGDEGMPPIKVGVETEARVTSLLQGLLGKKNE